MQLLAIRGLNKLIKNWLLHVNRKTKIYYPISKLVVSYWNATRFHTTPVAPVKPNQRIHYRMNNNFNTLLITSLHNTIAILTNVTTSPNNSKIDIHSIVGFWFLNIRQRQRSALSPSTLTTRDHRLPSASLTKCRHSNALGSQNFLQLSPHSTYLPTFTLSPIFSQSHLSNITCTHLSHMNRPSTFCNEPFVGAQEG